MKYTVLTVVFALLSTGCSFYAMVYPAWFQQEYRRDGNNVFQGYGIFAFYSTDALVSPFYASKTVLQYKDYCEMERVPNYMLGNGDQYKTVLCGKAMLSIQAVTATGAAVSALGLLASIISVYNPSAGIAEKVVSFCTLVGSLLLAVSLVIWGWSIQQRLYKVDSISSSYLACEANDTEWSCWFYGYSFWVCLAAVILLSITGYLSSAGRAEKIRYFRKEYERDLALAIQASMENDTAAQAHNLVGPSTGYVRTGTSPDLPATAQPTRQAPPSSASSSRPFNPHENSHSQSQSSTNDMAYPVYREQRPNHSLLGRPPSGGVV